MFHCSCSIRAIALRARYHTMIKLFATLRYAMPTCFHDASSTQLHIHRSFLDARLNVLIPLRCKVPFEFVLLECRAIRALDISIFLGDLVLLRIVQFLTNDGSTLNDNEILFGDDAFDLEALKVDIVGHKLDVRCDHIGDLGLSADIVTTQVGSEQALQRCKNLVAGLCAHGVVRGR